MKGKDGDPAKTRATFADSIPKDGGGDGSDGSRSMGARVRRAGRGYRRCRARRPDRETNRDQVRAGGRRGGWRARSRTLRTLRAERSRNRDGTKVFVDFFGVHLSADAHGGATRAGRDHRVRASRERPTPRATAGGARRRTSRGWAPAGPRARRTGGVDAGARRRRRGRRRRRRTPSSLLGSPRRWSRRRGGTAPRASTSRWERCTIDWRRGNERCRPPRDTSWQGG